MSDELKQQLDALEAELVAAYEEFKKVYKELYDNKELTDLQVYEHIMDKEKVFDNELDEIKKRTFDIMQRIHHEHDTKIYQEILDRLHKVKTQP